MSYSKSMIKRTVMTLLALGMAGATARATVTMNVSARYLKTAGGASLMPASGLVVLVASTNGGQFGSPTPTSLVGTGNLEVARWNLSGSGFGDGFLLDTTGPIGLSGGRVVGQALAIYWFPTLTVAASAPGVGTTYGFYRDPVANSVPGSGTDGSDPWYIPSDGSTVTIKMKTVEAGGSVPNATGYASLTVTNGSLPVTNTSSVVSLQFGVPGPNSNTITFVGISNSQYVVEYATNVVTGPWVPLSTNIATTNGSWSVIDTTATNSSRFYRSFH